MSNKLTREVIYLKESDRQKKVEPLSFNDYSKEFLEPSQTTSDCVEWNIKLLNEYALKYATYLQEFSAEEKAVEFTEYHNIGECGISTCSPLDYDTVEYLGKCQSDGDMFKAIKRGTFTIYYGNLNSGCY